MSNNTNNLLNLFYKIKDMPKEDLNLYIEEFARMSDNVISLEYAKEFLPNDLYIFLYQLLNYSGSLESIEEIINWLIPLNIKSNSISKILFNGYHNMLNDRKDKNIQIENAYYFIHKLLLSNNIWSYMHNLSLLDLEHPEKIVINDIIIIDSLIKNYNSAFANDYLMFFAILSEENFQKYFNKEYMKIFINCSYRSLIYYLNENLHNEKWFSSLEFLGFYSKLDLKKQLTILELLINQECNTTIINNLREHLNKNSEMKTIEDVILNVLEMTLKRFEIVSREIIYSSYVNNSEFDKKYIEILSWIKKLKNNEIPIGEIKKQNYAFLIDFNELLNKVKEYAKDSIVNSLYDVSKLESFINYIDEGEYNILVNTNEIGYNSSYFPHQKQIMDRFSIINSKSFSHTIYQQFIYAYFEDITSDKILLINPNPIDLYPDINKRKDIGKGPCSGPSKNYWLDIKDFNRIVYQNGIYGSIIIKTKKEDGSYIMPNCLISIGDTISRDEVLEASQKNLKILHLKRHNDTNTECEMIPSHHLG